MNNLPGCFLWRRKISVVKRKGTENDKDNFQARFNVHIDEQDHNVNITKNKKQSTNDIPDSVYIGQYPVLQEKTITKTVVIKEVKKGLSSTNLGQKKQTFCMSVKQLLRNKAYTGFVLGMTITLPVSSLIIFFLADIFVGNGLSKDDVSLGFFLYNMGNTIGRLLPGILLQTNYITPLSLPVFCAISAATEMILLSFLRSRWWSIILTSTIGLPSGMLLAMFTIGPVKLVGTDLLPVAIGLLFSCCALVQAAAGPVTGTKRLQYNSLLKLLGIININLFHLLANELIFIITSICFNILKVIILFIINLEINHIRITVRSKLIVCVYVS